MPEMKKFAFPVLIDTDIGDDIDDTWTLMYILASGAFDVRGILLTNFDTEYKAKLVCKMLTELSRTDIPIFVSESTNLPEKYRRGQEEWIADYDVSDYKGKIIREKWEDEVYRMIGNIESKVCIFELAPNTSLCRLYETHRDIAKKCFVYAMAGGVEKSYESLDRVVGEFNICADKDSAEKILSSDLDYTMLPLDVCASIRLKDEPYRRFLEKDTPYARIVKENYLAWIRNGFFENYNQYDIASSILFDMIVPWYALFPEFFEMQRNRIYLSDDITKIAEGNKHLWAKKLNNIEFLTENLVEVL